MLCRLVLIAVCLGSAHGVRAQTAQRAEAGPGSCGHAGRPWISIGFVGAAWAPELRQAVFDDLRAELGLSGFDACPLGYRGSEPPLAVIELRASEPGRVSVSIDVHDAVTEKRVAREVDLGPLPPDGRALTLAVAADELLRASWAELALIDTPEPSRAPPPEVARTVERSLKPRPDALPAPRPTTRIAARFALEHHGGGQTLFGPDVGVWLYAGERVGFGLALGVRQGLAETTDAGELRSSALTARAGVEVLLVTLERGVELHGRAGLQLGSVRYQGIAAGARAGRQGAEFDLHGFAALGLGAALAGPLGFSIDAGLGAPLQSVRAADQGRVLSSTSGFQLRGGLGLWVAL